MGVWLRRGASKYGRAGCSPLLAEAHGKRGSHHQAALTASETVCLPWVKSTHTVGRGKPTAGVTNKQYCPAGALAHPTSARQPEHCDSHRDARVRGAPTTRRLEFPSIACVSAAVGAGCGGTAGGEELWEQGAPGPAGNHDRESGWQCPTTVCHGSRRGRYTCTGSRKGHQQKNNRYQTSSAGREHTCYAVKVGEEMRFFH